MASVAIYEQGIHGLYAVQDGIALSPSKKAKYVHTIPKINTITRMWANAQPDGRLAEHRWRPLFNAAKFS